MSQFRLRRLQADYESVRRLVNCHPRIRIEGVMGNPPERYRLVLTVDTLRQVGRELRTVSESRLEVMLPRGYPRDAPVCRMLTPVFHPNIAPHVVCIGDHWTAAESLDLMIQRVGEMLAYQSYNTKSPLNGEAARWVDENVQRLPIDAREFFMDLREAERRIQTGEIDLSCANCGQMAPVDAMQCTKSHRLCLDCLVQCGSCNQVLCLTCGVLECERCVSPACANCGQPSVESLPCAESHPVCVDCRVVCNGCEAVLCLTCGEVPCAVCSSSTDESAGTP